MAAKSGNLQGINPEKEIAKMVFEGVARVAVA